jgi:hypothetical protein
VKLSIVDGWHRALATGDADAVLGLSAPDVVVSGPRGSAQGHGVLREWVGASGASLEPLRWFCGAGGDVVVAQRASWRDGAGGATVPLQLATRFVVSEGRIARIERHGALADALLAAGLTGADEVRAET